MGNVHVETITLFNGRIICQPGTAQGISPDVDT